MLDKYFNYIAVGLLAIILVQGFFVTPSGMSEEEHLYKLQIHDLKQEKDSLLSKNTELEAQLISFEDDILKNDSIIDNATSTQLDSMFTDYFRQYDVLYISTGKDHADGLEVDSLKRQHH